MDNLTADPIVLIAIGAAGIVALLILVVIWRTVRGQSEIGSRLKLLIEAQEKSQEAFNKRLIDQERALNQRLDHVSQRVGQSLEQTTTKTRESLAQLGERLAVMDEAQKNIIDLSNQMVSLQDILSNKQARGAFGEIQLKDLVEGIMPPGSYDFQASVGDNRRVDCLLKLPNPPGPIAIDAKFPLESWQRLQNAETDPEKIQAARDFSADILKHVKDIRERYIVPGETGEAALMFLPSEAIYAELHARYANVVEQSFRERVYIVSPTTLWATLNTVRAVFRDVQMREQAHVIQKEVEVMLTDVGRLDERVGKLSAHFTQASRDIEAIQTSSKKITRRGERIRELELDEEDDEALADAAGAALPGQPPAAPKAPPAIEEDDFALAEEDAPER
jgi:DNA recombination protein RmuC